MGGGAGVAARRRPTRGVRTGAGLGRRRPKRWLLCCQLRSNDPRGALGPEGGLSLFLAAQSPVQTGWYCSHHQRNLKRQSHLFSNYPTKKLSDEMKCVS